MSSTCHSVFHGRISEAPSARGGQRRGSQPTAGLQSIRQFVASCAQNATSRRRFTCSRSPAAESLKISRSLTLVARAEGGSPAPRVKVAEFPRDYGDVILQSQAAVKAAIADGLRLIEIEVPTLGLTNVPGDNEGCNEMDASAIMLGNICRVFSSLGYAEDVRVLFPDHKELARAKEAPPVDEDADLDNSSIGVFRNSPCQLDCLTTPTPLLELGIDINLLGKDQGTLPDRCQPSDRAYVAAYPSFNVNEMIAVEELYIQVAKESGCPIIVFNGELDRIRSGYYPKLFYPRLHKVGERFLPGFDAAYFIRNFKGTRPAVLFRAYPGPWQVLKRDPNTGELTRIHMQDTQPSLKEVATEIIPKYYDSA